MVDRRSLGQRGEVVEVLGSVTRGRVLPEGGSNGSGCGEDRSKGARRERERDDDPRTVALNAGGTGTSIEHEPCPYRQRRPAIGTAVQESGSRFEFRVHRALMQTHSGCRMAARNRRFRAGQAVAGGARAATGSVRGSGKDLSTSSQGRGGPAMTPA